MFLFNPWSCHRHYKGEPSFLLKVNGGTSKSLREKWDNDSGMADQLCIKRGSCQHVWNEVKILEIDERWGIWHLKESMHMLFYGNFLSRHNIEINKIMDPPIQIERKKDQLYQVVKHSRSSNKTGQSTAVIT